MSKTYQQYVDTVSSGTQNDQSSADTMARARRKSVSIGEDLRGDTGAPAISTLDRMPTITSPPLTPRPSGSKTPRASKRRKARSYLRRWKAMSFKHTWVNPLVLVLVLLSAYLVNPTPQNPLHHGIFLSYPLSHSDPLVPKHANPASDGHTYYGKGGRDFAFVAFYVIVFSFIREFLTQRVIRPMAIWFGIKSRGKQMRFMEQVYTAVYMTVSGICGLYVMSRTPVWYFNTTAMFEEFPIRAHEGIFKAYYLLQAAFWAQQAIVLCLLLEKPRSDFKEFVGHHIVTLALIWLSYRFHFTYMGVAVYVTHDISDFFLATSKTLSYLDSSITVPYFVLFASVWIYLRHYINLTIIYATLTTFRTVGPFELNWDAHQYKCWISQYITFSLLSSLQALNLFWLYLILRIAYRIMFGKEAKDVREEGEDTEDEAVMQSPTKDQDAAFSGAIEANQSEDGLKLNGSALRPEKDGLQHVNGVNGGVKKEGRKRD